MALERSLSWQWQWVLAWLQKRGASRAQEYSLEGWLGVPCSSRAHGYDEQCTRKPLPAFPSLSPLCTQLLRGFQGTADFCAERK